MKKKEQYRGFICRTENVVHKWIPENIITVKFVLNLFEVTQQRNDLTRSAYPQLSIEIFTHY